MSKLETIIGRIDHVGPYTYDSDCHRYNIVEVETEAGRVELPNAMAANALGRVIKEGSKVAMTVLRTGVGVKQKNILLGAYDPLGDRTFVDESLFNVQAHARKQAVLYSLMGVVVVPLGLAVFVVPGVLWLWLLRKSWSAVGEFPPADEIRQAVAGLRSAWPSRQ